MVVKKVKMGQGMTLGYNIILFKTLAFLFPLSQPPSLLQSYCRDLYPPPCYFFINGFWRSNWWALKRTVCVWICWALLSFIRTLFGFSLSSPFSPSPSSHSPKSPSAPSFLTILRSSMSSTLCPVLNRMNWPTSPPTKPHINAIND